MAGILRADAPEAFEDGTLNYLALPAVEIGLRYIRRIGIDMISERVRCLLGWLLANLLPLRHHTDTPLVQLFLQFATTFLDREPDTRGLPARSHY